MVSSLCPSVSRLKDVVCSPCLSCYCAQFFPGRCCPSFFDIKDRLKLQGKELREVISSSSLVWTPSLPLGSGHCREAAARVSWVRPAVPAAHGAAEKFLLTSLFRWEQQRGHLFLSHPVLNLRCALWKMSLLHERYSSKQHRKLGSVSKCRNVHTLEAHIAGFSFLVFAS